MKSESVNPNYKRYHPPWYRRRMPIFWWLRSLAYTKFISRELTSLGVAYCALLLLVQAWAVGRGAATYERFQEVLQTPAALILHGVILLVVLFHAITWLNLAPKALVVRLGGRRLPDGLILAGHYFAWIGVSALLAWLLIGG